MRSVACCCFVCVFVILALVLSDWTNLSFLARRVVALYDKCQLLSNEPSVNGVCFGAIIHARRASALVLLDQHIAEYDG